MTDCVWPVVFTSGQKTVEYGISILGYLHSTTYSDIKVALCLDITKKSSNPSSIKPVAPRQDAARYKKKCGSQSKL
jgi:hypothetical protein